MLDCETCSGVAIACVDAIGGTLAEAAERAGLHEQTVRRAQANDPVTLESLSKLARAAGADLKLLIHCEVADMDFPVASLGEAVWLARSRGMLTQRALAKLARTYGSHIAAVEAERVIPEVHRCQTWCSLSGGGRLIFRLTPHPSE